MTKFQLYAFWMNGPLPPLNGLRAFEAAARLLSFKQAADELRVTPTAISHHVARLEAFFGIKLFIREGRRLRLSRQGKDFLPLVSAGFADLRRATETLRQGTRREVLSVSTLTYVGAKWMVHHLGSFKARNPEIDVRITTSPSPCDFKNGDIDVAIRYGHGNWPGLHADWLMTQHILPVCSPAILDSALPLREPDDLACHTLLHANAEPDSWRLWLAAAGAKGVDVTRGLSFDQSIMAIEAAIDGLGIAIGRTPFIAEYLDSGQLIAPFNLALPDEVGFYLVAPEETANLPKIQAFRKWLLQVTSDASARRPASRADAEARS